MLWPSTTTRSGSRRTSSVSVAQSSISSSPTRAVLVERSRPGGSKVDARKPPVDRDGGESAVDHRAAAGRVRIRKHQQRWPRAPLVDGQAMVDLGRLCWLIH